MDCLLEQASEICLFKKGSGQNVFHEEIFFCGKRIHFPTLYSHYSLLFKHSVFSLSWGQTQYAYDFPKLSLILCL